jgi:hypothetical protein
LAVGGDVLKPGVLLVVLLPLVRPVIVPITTVLLDALGAHTILLNIARFDAATLSSKYWHRTNETSPVAEQ